MLRLTSINHGNIVEEQFQAVVNANSIEEKYLGPRLDKYKVGRADSHIRFVVGLCLPCINSVLCGSGYKNAARILGIKAEELEKIANFTLCMDARTKEIVRSADCSGLGKDYLFNGQVVDELISRLDIDEVIIGTFYTHLSKDFKNSEFTIERETGDYELYGDYRVSITSVPPNAGYVQDIINKRVNNCVVNRKFARIDMFINLLNECNNDPEAVKTYLKEMLVMKYIPISPLGSRPEAKGRRHPMTAAYTKLRNHNGDYGVVEKGSFDEFREYYKTLFGYVDTITCSAAKDTALKNDKTMGKVIPQLDLIKGKKGAIREKLLSKRQDYSGRAAVVVNPFQPIDTVGIPRVMIPKLYRLYALRDTKLSDQEIYKNLDRTDFDAKIVEALKHEGIIDDIPIMMGRNPTLHKHGIQGFKVVVTEGRAIEVSPLVCPAYNMDFDGDTAHVELPVTAEAAREVSKLIRSDRNILLPATSECTIVPRMDMIYGLYKCTDPSYQIGTSVKTLPDVDSLYEALYSLEVKVWDTVTVSGVGTNIAGKLAVLCCFPKSMREDIDLSGAITAKTIKKYIDLIVPFQGPSFNRIVNKLVELGFKMAFLYCGSVSVIRELNYGTEKTDKFDKAFEEFHASMAPIDELNDYGFYDSETYSIEYGKCFDKAKKALETGVFEKIGNNMFSDMAKSGARGNVSNLTQIYGSKGRIQKSEQESFNVVIENCLANQLTPIEHMIAAHGARRGQIAKSIDTADTGYLTRKLVHGTASIVVRSEDCGTDRGVTIRLKDIEPYLIKENMTKEDINKAKATAREVMARFITGRYDMKGLLISSGEAKRIAESGPEAEITVRSPLTCENPCCQKCYGIDPGTRRLVKIGTPVGILADHSISQPSTQLTMKVFQKGGVQGSSASAFDRLNAVIEQTNIRLLAKEGKFPSYDPVAWAPGTLVREPFQGKRVLLRIVPENEDDAKVYDYGQNRIIPEGVSVKAGKYVAKGEFLREERGDVYVPELEESTDYLTAALEEVYCLYFLFRSEVDLVPVHIQTMVSGLIGYRPITTNLKELKLGKYYTRRQLYDLGLDYSNTKFKVKVRGQLSSVTDNANFMESVIMEDQRAALSDAVLNGLKDLTDSPLVQVAFGWVPELGTGINPDYLED